MKKKVFIGVIAVVIAALALNGIGTTFAQSDAQSDTFELPLGESRTIEVGKAYTWKNTDTSILKLDSAKGVETATVTGIKVGKATISVGTSVGQVLVFTYNVVDKTGGGTDPGGDGGNASGGSGGTDTDGGLPGLDKVSVGGTIEIDGIEWIKVRDDKNNTTGEKYSLLIMKGVINPNGTGTIFAARERDARNYWDSEVRSVINGWYANTNMPTLKKYALVPALYPTPTASHTWCEKAEKKTVDIAFCPMKADVFNNLTTHQLENGLRWWTQTAPDANNLEILRADGVWGLKGLTEYFYARPCIYVLS